MSRYTLTISLDGRDRSLLVKLTAGYNEGFTPRPAEAKRLMLTALGAGSISTAVGKRTT